MLANQGRTVLDQFAILILERSGEMAVDIEFPDHLTADKYRDYDFRFGLERACEVAVILADIIHNNGLAAGGSRPQIP